MKEQYVFHQPVGFHSDCGGRVMLIGKFYFNSLRLRVYGHCSRCQASGVHPDHVTVVSQQPRRLNQKTAGLRVRRKRYDIQSWKEVR